MSRTARWVLAIALLQAGLVGVYWLVEHQRASGPEERLGIEPPERLERPMPALAVVHRGGRRGELRTLSHRTLVHVWATWCPPCRAELPGLLALPSQHDVAVVAIALDRSWADVERFLGDLDSSSVVIAPSEDVERALGVRTLPVTFLVEADGQLALRFDGARDWADETFLRTHVLEPVDGR